MLDKNGNVPKHLAGKPAAPTIYDVARLSGVSKTTVSRVINRDENVRARTRERVEEAIRTLHYQPNTAARHLASQTDMRIGLLYNNPSVSYFSELMIGALESCGRHGAQLIVSKCAPANPEAAREAVRKLADGGLNGMLLTAPLSESEDIIAELHAADIAIVGVATGTFRSDVSCIGIDDKAAAYEMTRYLIDAGHRRIAFIRGHSSHTSSKQRWLGYEAAMSESFGSGAGIVAQGQNSYRSGLIASEDILSHHRDVTAIFAGNDDMASGALSAAHRRGLSVPQDLSVVGFDDTIAATLWPELTTVKQPIFEIGARAIDAIVENVSRTKAGDVPRQKNQLIPHQLVCRESVAPPRAHAA